MPKNDFEQLKTIAKNYLDKNKNNLSHTNQPVANALIEWVKEKQRQIEWDKKKQRHKNRITPLYPYKYFSMSSALNNKYQELLDWKTVIYILRTKIQKSHRFSPLFGISATSTLIDNILHYFNQRLAYLAQNYCFTHTVDDYRYYPDSVTTTESARGAPAKSFNTIFNDMFVSLDRTMRFMQQNHPKKQSLTDGPDPYPSITDSHL